jgi:hypothetical protein
VAAAPVSEEQVTFEQNLESQRTAKAASEANRQAREDRARKESEEQICALAQACAKERAVFAKQRIEVTIGYCSGARAHLMDYPTTIGLWVCAFRYKGLRKGRDVTYRDSAFQQIVSEEADSTGEEYRRWTLNYRKIGDSIESVLSLVAQDVVSAIPPSAAINGRELQRAESIVTIGWFGRKYDV